MTDAVPVQAHSPEPWHASDRGIGWEVHTNPQPEGSCWAKGTPSCPSVTDGFRDTMKEADARRVVACVNAFAGVPQRQVEQYGHLALVDVERVRDLVEAARNVLSGEWDRAELEAPLQAFEVAQ